MILREFLADKSERMNFLRRAKKLFRKNGWRKYRLRIADDRRQQTAIDDYQKWITNHQLSAADRSKIRAEIELLNHSPLISILVPVYDVGEKWLRAMIDSVTAQLYENWELCLADDASPSPHVRQILEEYRAADSRIKVVFRESNGHISAASNTTLEMATGEFCALLDHDDALAEDALFQIAAEINRFPTVDFIYTDEDTIDEKGSRYAPKFKPDFSLDLLYSVNYVTHFAVYRTTILREIGGWHIGLEGSQDYDLALRVVERIPENHIRHIPRILYHWRAIRGSVALSGEEKPYAHERAREAIRAHLTRTGKQAKVTPTAYNLHRVQYDLPLPPPKVNMILLEKEDYTTTANALTTMAKSTDYPNLEIVLICSAATKKRFDDENPAHTAKIIVGKQTGEAEKYNAAVAQTDGEVLCFVDGNLRPELRDWLHEMISFAIQSEIGAVGAKDFRCRRNGSARRLYFGNQ